MKSMVKVAASFFRAVAFTGSADTVYPVTGWATLNGDAVFTGGSETTSSPIVTGLPGDTIAGNFPAVILLNGESLYLSGSVLLAGSAGGNQLRFGLFNGASPVVTSQGSGYAGINADAPSSGTGALKYNNGSLANMFSSGAATVIAPMSNPGGAAPAGIPIDFSLRLTRDGDNLDLEANISNIAGGGTWTSSSGVVQDYASPGGDSFNTVAFLLGSSIGGPTADFANVTVTYSVIPEPSTGLLLGLGLVCFLRRPRP